MKGKQLTCIQDWCRFKKGEKVVYLEGNDKISRVLHKGKEVWVKNKYFGI